MKGKKGRPRKKAVIQEKYIGFYVTFAQHAIMRRKAEEAHVTISDYLRQVALEGVVKAKWTPEEREMVKKLIGMSVDLHELVLAAGRQDVAIALDLFKRHREGMDEIIKKLCHDR